MAIILPGTSGSAARALAEDLRQRLRALAVPHAAVPRGIVTVSIGLCSVGPHDSHLTATQVLDRADEALWRKRRGATPSVRGGGSRNLFTRRRLPTLRRWLAQAEALPAPFPVASCFGDKRASLITTNDISTRLGGSCGSHSWFWRVQTLAKQRI